MKKQFLFLIVASIFIGFSCTKELELPCENILGETQSVAFKILDVIPLTVSTNARELNNAYEPYIQRLHIETTLGNYVAVLKRNTIATKSNSTFSTEEHYILSDEAKNFEIAFTVEGQLPDGNGFERISFKTEDGIEFMTITPFSPSNSNSDWYYFLVEFNEVILTKEGRFDRFFRRVTDCMMALMDDETYVIVATTGVLVGAGKAVAAGTIIGCTAGAIIWP